MVFNRISNEQSLEINETFVSSEDERLAIFSTVQGIQNQIDKIPDRVGMIFLLVEPERIVPYPVRIIE